MKLGDEIIGLSSTYVDDPLHAGTKEYLDVCNGKEEKFKCMDRQWDQL